MGKHTALAMDFLELVRRCMEQRTKALSIGFKMVRFYSRNPHLDPLCHTSGGGKISVGNRLMYCKEP